MVEHRIAMIQNNVVVNVSVWDGISLWNPQGYVLVDVTTQPLVAIGWIYDGAAFSPPAT